MFKGVHIKEPDVFTDFRGDFINLYDEDGDSPLVGYAFATNINSYFTTNNNSSWHTNSITSKC